MWQLLESFSVIDTIMKKMCSPGYHHNGFVATHTLGHTITYKNNAQKYNTPQKTLGMTLAAVMGWSLICYYLLLINYA